MRERKLTPSRRFSVVLLPAALAQDFKEFCRLNPGPCPLIHYSAPGNYQPDSSFAANADIRSDVPRYRVYRLGKLEEDEVTDIRNLLPDGSDYATFYLGCSFSFESALQHAGVPVRNIEQGRNVSMYKTTKPCQSSGPFHTNLVVSMRPIPEDLLPQVAKVTANMPAVHGPPIAVGWNGMHELGITDITHPDYGDAVTFMEGDVPVFWCCGVTAIEGAISASAPLTCTHSPGCMFVSDVLENEAIIQ